MDESIPVHGVSGRAWGDRCMGWSRLHGIAIHEVSMHSRGRAVHESVGNSCHGVPHCHEGFDPRVSGKRCSRCHGVFNLHDKGCPSR